jgi:hypothetical protein
MPDAIIFISVALFMDNLVTTSCGLTSSSYSDSEVTQWVLRVWRESASQSVQGALLSTPVAGRVAHSNNPLTLQQAAVRLFGDKYTLSDVGGSSSSGSHERQYGLRITDLTALRRRYRQLALRVHPDKNPSDHAAAAFQLVQSCFEHTVAAGSSATQWTWFPPPQTTTKRYHSTRAGDGQQQHEPHDGVASVPSSFFSSSSSTLSRSSSYAAGTASSSSSLSSAHRCHAVPCWKNEKHRGDTTRPSPVRRQRTPCSATAAPPPHAGAAGVPEPPTVLFEAGVSVPDPRSNTPLTRCNHWGEDGNLVQPPFPPSPPPPPPFVFGNEDDGESAMQQSHTSTEVGPPPRKSMSGRRGEGYCQRHTARSAHAPRDEMSSGYLGRPESFPDKDAGNGPYKTKYMPSKAGDSRATEATFVSDVPSPPKVLGSPLSSPTTLALHKASFERSSSGVAVRLPHRRRPELPSLAELLARLDVEDDNEVGIEDMRGTARFYDPSARTEFKRHAHAPALRSSSLRCDINDFSDAVGTTQVAGLRRSHHHRPMAEAGQAFPLRAEIKVSSEGVHNVGPDLRDSGAAAAQLPSPSLHHRTSAYSSLFREAVGRDSAAQRGLSDGLPASPPATALRSRRAGDVGGDRPHTMRPSSESDRCACGKARKGQCFLCD